ncbi:RNA polymerase sigma factor [Alkalicoccobacillus murimartini]|uniref:RNA polymerase sigma-70 factor (ECF subfamily) n=1 Tax=Alkalicoccobacillus murimartini TaxID=171685 RepID=A0ABT9YI96_9BACI|nr:sigma-70 family RNA polymerase sigma factor [Alkalicoccobacillus murimartini]MDQ0207414.1 RNA polymerase sigma-70 factor (ECF subfamily) [Alkalicoccobacillus murimartini]
MEDKDLIHKILEGDEFALEELHKRYARQIYHYIYTETRNYDDAEEILQEVFYKVSTKLNQFKRRSSFKTWIYVITRNAIVDYYRKQENQLKTIPLQEELIEHNGGFERDESLTDLQHSIERLPLTYRRILHLRYIEGFSLLDTARITGVSVMSVKSTQKRAKKMLKTQLDEGVACNG